MTEWFVVVNPAASGGRNASSRAADALDSWNIDYELVAPRSRADFAQVLHEAIADGKTRFVAVGGDGE